MYHIVFVFLWPVYFTQHDDPQVHPCCSIWQHFLPFKAESYFILCIYHILCTHSAADGSLGYSHFLASDQGYHEHGFTNMSSNPVFISFFSIYPEAESLDHRVIPLFIFEELPYCITQWPGHFTFLPTASRVLISPNPRQHFFFPLVAILMGGNNILLSFRFAFP